MVSRESCPSASNGVHRARWYGKLSLVLMGLLMLKATTQKGRFQLLMLPDENVVLDTFNLEIAAILVNGWFLISLVAFMLLFSEIEGVLTSSQEVQIQPEIATTGQHWILMGFSEYILAPRSRAMEAGFSHGTSQRTFALRFREIWGW